MLLTYINIIVSQHTVAKDLGNNAINDVIDVRLFCTLILLYPNTLLQMI